jgi:hypothetical protein
MMAISTMPPPIPVTAVIAEVPQAISINRISLFKAVPRGCRNHFDLPLGIRPVSSVSTAAVILTRAARCRMF